MKQLTHILWFISLCLIIVSCQKENRDQSELSLELPKIETEQVRNVTSSSAFGGGEITDDGGGEIMESGLCWSESNPPTTSDYKGVNYSGLNKFELEIKNLNTSSKYYLRAYAVNKKGTNYGSVVDFTTSRELTKTQSIARLIVIETNKIRNELGLDALVETEIGNALAQYHSSNMSEYDFFSHTDNLGESVWERARRFGLVYSTLGENIARRGPYPSNPTAELVAKGIVKIWVDSPGHYQNMVSNSYNKIGVGVVFNEKNEAIATQVFYHN